MTDKKKTITISFQTIKKPKDLSKWLGLYCITKDKITKGKISSIDNGIVDIRVFGRSPAGMAHYPIKDILCLIKL